MGIKYISKLIGCIELTKDRTFFCPPFEAKIVADYSNQTLIKFNGVQATEYNIRSDSLGNNKLEIIVYNDGLQEKYYVEIVKSEIFSPDRNKNEDILRMFEKYRVFSESLLSLIDNNTLSYERLLDELEYGNSLRLYEVEQLLNEVLAADEHIQEIEKHTSYIINIFNKPRMDLKMQYEVRPINSVNRIDHTAISHIAAHSEHWEARTASGLIPSRLYAQVLEDNLEIYENVVLKNLVDFIISYLIKKKAILDEALRQSRSMDLTNIKIGHGSVDFYNAIGVLARDIDTSSVSGQNKKILEALEKVEELLIKYANCRTTILYRKLKKCMQISISQPIKATNVLMMDYNYRHIRVLWNYFQKVDEKLGYYEESGSQNVVPMAAYINFVQVLLLFSISRMRFKPSGGEKQIVGHSKGDKFFIDGKFVDELGWEIALNTEKYDLWESGIETWSIIIKFTHKQKTVFNLESSIRVPEELMRNGYKNLLSVDNGCIIFTEKLNDDDLNIIGDMGKYGLGSNSSEDKYYYRQWKKYIDEKNRLVPEKVEYKLAIVPIMYKLPNSSIEAKEISGLILNGYKLYKDAARVVFVTPFELTEYDQINDTQILDRLMSYGCNYSNEDAVLWGDYKSCILPLSLNNINSYRRICKLINTTFFYLDSNKDKFTICPFCGETTYNEKCDNCQIELHYTSCSKCNHKYAYTRPEISEKDIKEFQGALTDKNYANLREDVEMLLGFFNITDFNFIEVEDFLRKPVCPKCGHNSNYGK